MQGVEFCLLGPNSLSSQDVFLTNGEDLLVIERLEENQTRKNHRLLQAHSGFLIIHDAKVCDKVVATYLYLLSMTLEHCSTAQADRKRPCLYYKSNSA